MAWLGSKILCGLILRLEPFTGAQAHPVSLKLISFANVALARNVKLPKWRWTLIWKDW